MSPSLRQRFFKSKEPSPPSAAKSTTEMSGSTLLTPDAENASPTTATASLPAESDREHGSSRTSTVANHRVPFYRRRVTKSETELSADKPAPRRRRVQSSLLSRFVQKVVPCVPDADFQPPPSPLANIHEGSSAAQTEPIAPLSPVPVVPPAQQDVEMQEMDLVVPPSRPTNTLPPEETSVEGVTSGAVQPPGSTGEPMARIPTRESDDSEATSYMEDDSEDLQVVDEQAEEQRLIRNGGAGIPIGPDGTPRPLLPPITAEHTGRKCLVLDLDETLVHSSFRPVPNADFVVPVEIDFNWHHFHVLKRPGVDRFLQQMGEHYEIVVYTASLSKYADPVLDQLDTTRAVTHRLFRESCYNHKGNYVKDLSQLGRPIADTIILDNSPASYIFHPNNAVPVSSWFNDPHDVELIDLVPFLIDLKVVPDVQRILNPAR